MAVPDYLGFAQQPGPLQTAVSTAGQLQKMQEAGQQSQIAQQAAERAQQLAPSQLQTAQQTTAEQPVKFHSDIATATSKQHLAEAQAKKALAPPGALQLKGPAGDAASLQYLKQTQGENSEVYQHALNEFQAVITLKKKRASFYGANVWKKHMTPLQNTQFTQDFQNENSARQKQGLPLLTSEQFAVAAGYKPPDSESKATAISAQIDETHLQQIKNNQPITPVNHVINHFANGGTAQQLPGVQTPPTPPQILPQQVQAEVTAGGPPQQGSAPQAAPPAAGVAGAPAPVPIPAPAPGVSYVAPPPPQAGPPSQAAGAPIPSPGAPGQPQQAGTPAPQAGAPGQQAQVSGQPQLITTPRYSQQAAQTGLSTLRQTSDAKNRDKIVYGNQAENTIKNMQQDLSAMLHYAGPTGSLALAADRGVFQQTGKAPSNYVAYQRFASNASILSDQLTNYFGKSIMPEARKNLDELTNPRNWLDAPKVSLARFNTMVKTFSQELNIRKDALQNPSAYYSDASKGPKSYSNADYAKTAKETGQTIAQVKADLAKRRG